MKYKAVIFDLDGTLLDTLDDLADAMNAALADFGMPPHPVDSYRFFVGEGIANLAERAATAGADAETLKKLVLAMGSHYQKNWFNKTKPYPGIEELLASLRMSGVRLAILSNKPDLFTQLMAKHFFAEEMFEAVAGAIDGVPRKPDPEGALNIAARLDIPPADILYVGDSGTDMRTAVNAGMFPLGVSWGFRPAGELTESGAQSVVDVPQHVLWFIQ